MDCIKLYFTKENMSIFFLFCNMQQNIYIEVLFHPINLLDRIGNNWREIKVTNHFALSPSFPQEKIVDMKKFSLIAHFPNVKSLAVSVFHFQKSCCLRPPFVLFHFILLFWNHTLTWSVDDIYMIHGFALFSPYTYIEQEKMSSNIERKFSTPNIAEWKFYQI